MAQTGAILGARCYPSQADALDAYYSGIAPVHAAGATSYVLDYVKSGGVWHQRSFEISEAGSWSLRSMTAVPALEFPACDPTEKFMDGMAIGWGVVAAMAAVGAVILMKRGARGG